ncbi:MAG: ATP-dependent helicase HrpB [Hyphomicrobiales bacterium]
MLPIEAVRTELLQKFRFSQSLVLMAEPGAGKTTQVPLWLLEEAEFKEHKIVLLEPRRIAARAAAQRLAHLLGEELGQTVGLRMRAETRVSKTTRLEVVTEGVFSRMILNEPDLPGIGAVLFDEFHERSLDADLGLALALEAQSALRPDLKLMVLSATIDVSAISKLMDGAAVVTSKGRGFPVETSYLRSNKRLRIAPQIVETILQALDAENGSLLVFLPGRSEIETVSRMLQDSLAKRPNILIAPLYAGLPQREQSLALEPATTGMRKIVLSTTLAQTSMTIEGVRVVIDSGLTRRPRYNPQTGVSRLETVRVSVAAADQRRGRAGRTEPGACYRLWAEPETRALAAQDRPEILETNLSRFALDLAEWGVTSPDKLAFLDQPSEGHFTAAKTQLQSLEAIDSGGRITELGKRIQRLPLDPHLSVMLLQAETDGQKTLRSALILASLLTDGLSRNELDLRNLYTRAINSPQGGVKQTFERLCRWFSIPSKGGFCPRDELGGILLPAFPDWVAKNQGGGHFQLVAGQRVLCPTDSELSSEKYLIVADLMGEAANLRLLAACPLDVSTFEDHAARHAETKDRLFFNELKGRVKAEKITTLGALLLEKKPKSKFDRNQAEDVFWQAIGTADLKPLFTSQKITALIGRLQFLHNIVGDPWPNSSFECLQKDLESWLRPFLPSVISISGISETLLAEGIRARVAPIHDLNELAPERFQLTEDRSVAIDYSSDNGPTLHARVQEFYGMRKHPTIAGSVPLILDLLSPARRSIQITKNLPAFWQGSWSDVRADMRGRYPKHHWPEDPSQSTPVQHTRKR